MLAIYLRISLKYGHKLLAQQVPTSPDYSMTGEAELYNNVCVVKMYAHAPMEVLFQKNKQS